MKRFVKFLTIICILMCSFTVNAEISVFVNNSELVFDTQPIVKEGRTLVPVRGIFEALGMTVEWNGETNTVTAQGGGTIVLTIGSNTAYVNGQAVALDVAPEIINDRTLVPLRFISESAGCNVGWQEKTENIYITSGDNKFVRNMTVIFCDVGQGDCAIVLLPDGKNILIDSGTKGNADKILGILNSCGVNTLDYVIGTHPHDDHLGGMEKIISNVSVGDIYMPRAENDTQYFLSLLTCIKNMNKTIKPASSGVIVFDKNGLKGEFVSPVKSFSDLNNCSAVFKLTYLNREFLFTGDMEEAAENTITADISADVLKVGHHGSDTSTSQAFLSRVNPQYGIISVGENNSYGHPSADVLNRLASFGVTVYRTDISGNITATTNGDSLDFSFREFVTENTVSEPVYAVSEIVYITKTGTKYHLYGCKYLSKSCIEKPLAEVSNTHTPCSVCFE